MNWQIASGKTVALNTNFGAGGWVNTNRTMTVNGAFQINQGAWPGNTGTWIYGTEGTLIYNNDSGSYGVGNDNYWPTSNGPVNVRVFGAGGITMNVARTVNGTFQTAAGVRSAYNLTVNGTVQIDYGGWFDSAPIYGANATLVYNPGGSCNISYEWTSGGGGGGGAGAPRDVTIQNETVVVLPTGAGARAVPGTLNINSGSLTLGGNNGDDLYVGGDWINDDTFNANNRAVIFNGSGVQTISGSSVTAFDYLIVNSGATVVIPADNTPTVDDSLTNNGALRQTREVNGASTTFLNISTDKYYGVVIDPGSNNLGETTVTVYGNQLCPNANIGVKRCFELDPEYEQSATVTFYFTEGERNGETLSALNVWHWDGSAWDREEGTTTCDGSGDAQRVQVTDVSSYSPFALSGNSPTAVTLARFEAIAKGNAIRLEWETASELNIAGFNLHRSTARDGKYEKLNDALIPPHQPSSLIGATYVWTDTNVLPGVTYYYRLEDVDTEGGSGWHEPVWASLPRVFRVYLPLLLK